MPAKWIEPTRETLLKWLFEIKSFHNWKKLSSWEKEYINGWTFYMKKVDFKPTRTYIEKLEEIYVEKT